VKSLTRAHLKRESSCCHEPAGFDHLF